MKTMKSLTVLRVRLLSALAAIGCGLVFALPSPVANADPVDTLERAAATQSVDAVSMRVPAGVDTQAAQEPLLRLAQHRGDGQRGGDRGGRHDKKNNKHRSNSGDRKGNGTAAAVAIGVAAAAALLIGKAVQAENNKSHRVGHNGKVCRRWARKCDNGKRWACHKYRSNCY